MKRIGVIIAAFVGAACLSLSAQAKSIFSQESGTYSTTQLILIDCEQDVYYTTDGTDPNEQSEKYCGIPIVVSENTLIKTALDNSGELEVGESLTIKIKTPSPSASLDSGTYNCAQTVKLSCEKGCTIYYTTDGSKPTKKSAKYTKPITISKTTTLRFMAVKSGCAKSSVIMRKYVISNDVYPEKQRQELFELVNEERAKYGLSPLEEMPELSVIAQKRAKECASYFSHWRADGTKWDYLLSLAGLKRNNRAENICYYYSTAKQALNSWLADYAHRKNILDPDLKYIGIGYYNNGACCYWTQIFIGED